MLTLFYYKELASIQNIHKTLRILNYYKKLLKASKYKTEKINSSPETDSLTLRLEQGGVNRERGDSLLVTFEP